MTCFPCIFEFVVRSGGTGRRARLRSSYNSVCVATNSLQDNEIRAHRSHLTLSRFLAFDKIEAFQKQRESLDAEIMKLQQFISATANLVPDILREATLSRLESTQELQSVRDIGLTEAVQIVLKSAEGDWLTVAQVRDRLLSLSFDFGLYTSNPLASISTALHSLPSALFHYRHSLLSLPFAIFRSPVWKYYGTCFYYVYHYCLRDFLLHKTCDRQLVLARPARSQCAVRRFKVPAAVWSTLLRWT